MEGKESPVNRKMSRREACGILVALGGASAAALFGIPRIDPYAFDKPPKADFDYTIAKPSPRTAKYINPTSEEELQFTNLSIDPDNENNPLNALRRFLGYRVPQPLSSSWYVDDMIVAATLDYSTKLPASSIGTEHKVGLRISDGRKENYVEKLIEVDPDQLYPIKKLDNIPLKGINYDAGVNWDGFRNWRNLTDEKIEIELVDAINKELSCNTIRIVGDDDNIFRVANIAIEKGHFDEIAISPRFISETMDNTITRVADIAEKAEKIREKFDRITFIVGNELPIETRGLIVDAPTYGQRNDEIQKCDMRKPEYQNRLNEFLKKLIVVTSENFGGKITYASTWWEPRIRWEELNVDIISSNQFYHRYNNADQISESIKQQKQTGKPIYITEFGCTTFEGAFEAGGGSWNPEFYKDKKYSQEEQAKAIEWYVNLFNKIKVDGIFLAVFLDTPEDDIRSWGIFRCRYYKSNTVNGWPNTKPERKLGCYMYKSYIH